jgi:hypothetical protein
VPTTSLAIPLKEVRKQNAALVASGRENHVSEKSQLESNSSGLLYWQLYCIFSECPSKTLDFRKLSARPEGCFFLLHDSGRDWWMDKIQASASSRVPRPRELATREERLCRRRTDHTGSNNNHTRADMNDLNSRTSIFNSRAPSRLHTRRRRESKPIQTNRPIASFERVGPGATAWIKRRMHDTPYTTGIISALITEGGR